MRWKVTGLRRSSSLLRPRVAVPLVYITENDMASFNVGADATSQYQMIEINFGHCLLTSKRRKALCRFVNNRLSRHRRNLQKDTGRLGGFRIVAVFAFDKH